MRKQLCRGLYLTPLIALGAAAVFGTTAEAAGLMPTPLPPLVVPAESWTGFSVGVGGGAEFFNADVNAKASRTDTVGECETGPVPHPPNPTDAEIDAALVKAGCAPGTQTDLFSTKQSLTSNLNDLGETGGFFTVQGAYMTTNLHRDG
jgi:hypothetical protein